MYSEEAEITNSTIEPFSRPMMYHKSLLVPPPLVYYNGPTCFRVNH